jgi:hypothetical protein
MVGSEEFKAGVRSRMKEDKNKAFAKGLNDSSTSTVEVPRIRRGKTED